jgi:hypothetical protein
MLMKKLIQDPLTQNIFMPVSVGLSKVEKYDILNSFLYKQKNYIYIY